MQCNLCVPTTFWNNQVTKYCLNLTIIIRLDFKLCHKFTEQVLSSFIIKYCLEILYAVCTNATIIINFEHLLIFSKQIHQKIRKLWKQGT